MSDYDDSSPDTEQQRFGSGTAAGAGYGNKHKPDAAVDGDDTRFGTHTNTDSYSNATDYGSGATAGVGFGNKTGEAITPSQDYDNSAFRFDKHTNTDPYSNSTAYGSGSTGGAGFGNETGSFSADGEKKDSTMGRMMEKAGNMFHNKGMVEKGQARRALKGFGQDEDGMDGE